MNKNSDFFLLAEPLALLLRAHRLAHPENLLVLDFEHKMPVNIIWQLSLLEQKYQGNHVKDEEEEEIAGPELEPTANLLSPKHNPGPFLIVLTFNLLAFLLALVLRCKRFGSMWRGLSSTSAADGTKLIRRKTGREGLPFKIWPRISFPCKF